MPCGGEKRVACSWPPSSLQLSPCPLTEQELLVVPVGSQPWCPEESGFRRCLVRWVCMAADVDPWVQAGSLCLSENWSS